MRPWTLVASTISSRLVKSLSARPVISSLLPAEYTFAVSKKLIPASRASLMIRRPASSSRTHWWPPRVASPQLMHPSVTTETSSPVLPSFWYLIVSPSRPSGPCSVAEAMVAAASSGQPDVLLRAIHELVVIHRPDRDSGERDPAHRHRGGRHRMALGVLPGFLALLVE